MLQITKYNSLRNQAVFSIYIEAQLINLSEEKNLPLNEISKLIIKQLKNTYNFEKANYTCSVRIKIELIKHEHQVNSNKLLFCITPKIINNNLAQANFKGSIIKINNLHLSLLKSEQNRTIPHELGHIFGWDHPHAKGVYESINLEADPNFEQTLTENERKNNLMSQSWYVQNSGKTLDEGKEISLGQLELLLNNFANKKLGNKFHLKGWWLWKKVRL